jgi:hypothetical protein
LVPTDDTKAHYEFALLAYLRGDYDSGDALLRERYARLLEETGQPIQRFTPYFPGALVAALGPSDTAPAVEWLFDWIEKPPFPGYWLVHRAIAALLLAELRDPRRAELSEASLNLLDVALPDPHVRRWIAARAHQLRN